MANPLSELLDGKFRIFVGGGEGVMRVPEQAGMGRIGQVHHIFQRGGRSEVVVRFENDGYIAWSGILAQFT